MAQVDHAQRRQEVCAIAGRLIARAGIEAVTFRDIAAEAGCSTRIVSHYFRDKRALLLAIFLEFSGRSLDRCEAALTAHTDPAVALEAVLPLDEERRMFWQVWLAFWGRIIGDDALQSAQVERAHQMRAMIERLLATGRTEAGTTHDRGFEADRLLTTIVGIATQGIFDPAGWTPDRQRRHLRAEMAALGYA